jgi:uracil phosphoribosyltransferase
MIKILDHPLVNKDLTILRNRNTNSADFRAAISRICYHLAIEVTKFIDINEIKVETPLEITEGYELNSHVILMPIIRAGLGLLDGFTHIIPEASIGYIGIKRDEDTFQPVEYHFSLPNVKENTIVIILEVMLATGGSIANTITRLQLEGVSDIIVAAIIAAPEGVERLITEYPDLKIITAVLDRELNENKYILPGLGDAGDRINGTA